MKRYYAEPELEIRKYSMSADAVTTSDPETNESNDLTKDDQKDYFSK